MAKEGTVAPRERVNITYRPATGDAKEEVELPLKLLVMGDFTGAPDDRPLEKRDPVNIDKDNFDDVLRGQKVGIDISVPNRLTGKEGDEMRVKLDFASMKDFGPEAVADQVPELKKLLELREAVKSLKSPMSNVPEFRKKIQELVKDEAARKRLLKEVGIEE